MSYESSVKIKTNKNSKVKHKEEIYQDIQENNIRIIRRTLENNTHIVIEDSKLNFSWWKIYMDSLLCVKKFIRKINLMIA